MLVPKLPFKYRYKYASAIISNKINFMKHKNGYETKSKIDVGFILDTLHSGTMFGVRFLDSWHSHRQVIICFHSAHVQKIYPTHRRMGGLMGRWGTRRSSH